jgi:fructoselysine 6-phosphate deglycase
MEMNKIIRDILDKQKLINNVFFIACGGSLVDLYPAKYLMDVEANGIHTSFYTSNEFVSARPSKIKDDSISILCSHGGSTAETVEAARLAKDMGSSVIALTHTAGSGIELEADYRIIYQWGDGVSVQDQPMAICLSLMNELLYSTESYPYYKPMADGILKIDGIVKNAIKSIQTRTREFAEKYKDEPIMYVVSSGASWGQAYGFSICSMMEMQWKHASYIHSGEFFHGPFEVTDRDVLYILMMNEGKTRNLDERVLKFLNQYASKIEVVDAKEFSLGEICNDVIDYFNPILFYSVMCEYRNALAKVRNHPLETRRYMGKVPY